MNYNEKLANRIREHLLNKRNVEEKEMFGGLAFMINDKMCVGIIKDELVCRINPKMYEDVLEKPGCREMDFTGKPMKGWIMVGYEGLKTKKDFEFWINLALEYNKIAKSSKKKN